ncbi:hypothetical protein ACO2Q8_12915 [Larkinella sp. VNQ87]|uniref:hypothetical protein n=1 Tax=Larkinella sp. VNQ87 TaxID=3400921 RepID=UPI003BFDA3B8
MEKVSSLLARPVIAGLLFLVPLLAFAVFFFRYSANVPWFDDFESIPYFLQRFLDLPGWRDKAEALLRPNNEHRVLYARLVVWGYYLLTGTINFKALMFIGNASFLVVLALFYQSLRRAGLPAWYLLPVPFLLFNAQNQLLTFTALFTLQYLAIIMLVFLSIYQLAKNAPSSFGLAILLAFLTTFSMGNGMLVWAAGAVVLFYQRQWLRLGGWLGLMALAIYLYFYGYPVQQGNQEGFAFLAEHFLQIISGFFVFIGSFFDLVPQWPLAWRSIFPFVAGIVMVGFLAVWSFQVLFRTTNQPPTHWNAFFLGCLVFLICNAGIVALFRTRFGFGMMVWGSYRAYAMVLISITYLIFIGSRSAAGNRRERLVPVFLLPAMAIAGLSYVFGIPIAVDNLNMNRAKIFDQHYNQTGLGGTYNSKLGDFIAMNIDLMKNRGWYELPRPSLSEDEQRLFEPVSGTIIKPDWAVSEAGGFISVDSQDAAYPPNYAGTVFLILKSKNRTYVWTGQKRRPSRRNPLAVTAGFRSSLPKSMLQPGQYRLGVLEVPDDGPTTIRYTDRFVTVQ